MRATPALRPQPPGGCWKDEDMALNRYDARGQRSRNEPSPPEPTDIEQPADEPQWRAWMRDLGRRQRRIREFLGLSQEQVARLAGVSQGAVSRLETGRGLATPLLIVLKISAALARELRRVDPAVLSSDVREAAEMQAALVPSSGAFGFQDSPLVEDPELEALVRLWREAPARHRPSVLSVMRAIVTGLKTTAPLVLMGFVA
jgi:transcriptional regulator with XRE-family HTH domain